MMVDLINRFKETRVKTEELCAPLLPEDYLLSVTEDTSPPKWHLAHTSWFFEHFILEKFNSSYECYSKEFNFLFNSYYKTVGNYLPKSKRAFITRPTTGEVYDYRQKVSQGIIHLAETVSSQNQEEFFKILEIGINHEEQHQELLLMDIKRNFFENPLRPIYAKKEIKKCEASQSEWIHFDAALVTIGVSSDSTEFSYDNEKGQHKVWIENFKLSSHLVTNQDFLSFVSAGGYENSKLWLSDGWEKKENEKWSAPLYWEKRGDEWWTMSHGGMIRLDLEAPVVHVSYYEAHAYAKWKSARLPSEAEWEVASRLELIKGEFLEASSDEQFKVFSKIHGSVWEWTSSSYAPYPRYEPLGSGLNEYNEKFMCNQFVLRGGCSLTPRKHYRPTYRNFYYPHMRWQYAGIRLAKDVT